MKSKINFYWYLKIKVLGSKKNIDNIFKRFYSNRPKNFGEHSGLGLNIVKNIVELHKGKIKAINRPDVKGAQIELMFPKYS